MNCPLCEVQMNCPILFPKVQSLLELTILFIKNVEFKRTPPSAESHQILCCGFPKCRICLSSPLCFYKMWSLLEISTVFCKIQSSHELPPLWSPLELLSCSYKMRSSNELPTVLLNNVEFVSSPHSVFTKCTVRLNPPV